MVKNHGFTCHHGSCSLEMGNHDMLRATAPAPALPKPSVPTPAEAQGMPISQCNPAT